MSISAIIKDSLISVNRINGLPDIAGKERPAVEPDAGSFQDLFNQAVSSANPRTIQELTSPTSRKRIQGMMDIELLDMMDEDHEEKPDFIFNLSCLLEPPAVSNDTDLHEASKNQRIINTNDVLPNINDVLPSKHSFDAVIENAAKIHDMDPDLIKSVIQIESNFHPESTSSAGAMGLMQLMPGTAKDLGVKNAYDPVENIMGGTKYLKSLLNRYGGDTSLALAAYNWGAGNLEKNPDKMPRETRNYISKVTQHYRDSKA
ncbi:lytic transglycosylase domain-containing protein [Desulfobacterium sp. N47]|uniref:lytic transglycosylase domain-containing protein n=1 Tax=Desulfobacterium sp. N47 TaxID=3115210 RepID=UPI003C8DD490